MFFFVFFVVHHAVESGVGKCRSTQKLGVEWVAVKIRIETAFDLSYLQSGDRNVDLKQIYQRRGVSDQVVSELSVRFDPPHVLASYHGSRSSVQTVFASVMKTSS